MSASGLVLKFKVTIVDTWVRLLMSQQGLVDTSFILILGHTIQHIFYFGQSILTIIFSTLEVHNNYTAVITLRPDCNQMSLLPSASVSGIVSSTLTFTSNVPTAAVMVS